jgi:hypothetical protein
LTTTSNTPQNESMTERIQGNLTALVAIATGKSAHLSADISGAYPEPHREADDPVKVTPAKARAALARFIKGAAATSTFCNHMTKDMVGNATLLGDTYTITAGKNKGTSVPALAYGLVRMRREDRRAMRQAKRQEELASAQDNGGVFYAAGVEDKDGVGVPYPNETAARKAWCRAPENYGSNWWEDKDAKAGRLAEAVITRGTYVATETHEVINTTTVTTKDAALIAAAQTLGSKATTVTGARKFLANLS